jgi:Cft2 family RNA processing exonuclease
MLTDFSDMNDFHQVHEWLKKSSFPKLIVDHDKAEKIVLEGQKVLKKFKSAIEEAMRKGA